MKKQRKHKWKYRINLRKKILVLVILGVSLFVGLGYALLETNLGIFGTLEVGQPFVTVTFDANGGQVDTATKKVIPGRTYGNLPSVIKSNSEFIGWHGKNLFDANYFKNEGIYIDDVVTIDSVNMQLYKLKLKSNTQYTLSLDFNGYSASDSWCFRIYDGAKTNYAELQTYNDVKNYPSVFTITLTTNSEGNLYFGHLYGFDNNDRMLSYLNTVKIQLEEGTVATSYEPYYIENLTKVVNDYDHTLTAIWGTKMTNNVIDYNYDNNDKITKEFVVPYDGIYKLETWGAQGGVIDNIRFGGYGGYSVGNISLYKNNKIYITVGGSGSSIQGLNVETVGGYNGGGNAVTSFNHSDCYSTSGGGATHMALEKDFGELKNYNDNRNAILIVAGGGGGFYYDERTATSWGTKEIGNGGGYQGVQGVSYGGSSTTIVYSDPSTQTTGNAFGLGSGCQIGSECAGGGGGWYGGPRFSFTGSGGSGYIGNKSLGDKKMYCYDCTEALSTTTDKDIFTVSTTGSSQYIDSTNCPNGYSANPISKCAKSGDGYARITYLGN